MTVVVGFPPDKEDTSSIELAATLARSMGQDLLAVTVVPAPWPTPVAGNTDREFRHWARQQGEAGAAEAAEVVAAHCPDLSTRSIWVHDKSVAAGLSAQADKADATMLVIGSGNDGSYGHIHLGATGDRLLHSGGVPVAIAPRGYRAGEDARVRRVTCAFRGDDVSRHVLDRTATICADSGTGLRVVTFAVRGRTMYPTKLSTSTEDDVMDRWVAQATEAQDQALKELGDQHRLPADVERVVARGRNWGAAIGSLDWDNDEMLVIGSSPVGLMERLFLGSSGSKVVRHSPVPVIVVP